MNVQCSISVAMHNLTFELDFTLVLCLFIWVLDKNTIIKESLRDWSLFMKGGGPESNHFLSGIFSRPTTHAEEKIRCLLDIVRKNFEAYS